MRIQSRQQDLKDLQPSKRHGRGKPQRDLFWRRRHTVCPWASRQKTTTRGRRPPIHVSTGRTFNGGVMEQKARMKLLRQEVRRLSRMNATYRELTTSPHSLSASSGVASDNSGVASPRIVPGTTGKPANASPGAAPTAPSTPAAGNAPTASRTGRRLEVTRASRRNSQNDEDTVDSSEVPRALLLAHTMRPDPSALTFSQLLETAAKASGFVIETETAEFAHLDGDPFASSRPFVYATELPLTKDSRKKEISPSKSSTVTRTR